jgi:hypothetical protein
VRLRKRGLTWIVMMCHDNSRSFKWTVQIREIVAGQFFCYSGDFNPSHTCCNFFFDFMEPRDPASMR